MAESRRYPGYDVLAKWDTPSWNEQTRKVIDRRLSLPDEPRFLSREQWQTLRAVCERIVPQPDDRPTVPVWSLVDEQLVLDQGDGYREPGLPRLREAWRRGLDALDAEARAAHGRPFHVLEAAEQDGLLRRAQDGELDNPAWGGMPAKLFFEKRLLRDIVHAYWSHPTAWSEMGFGGPASPRGYVRLDADRRDSWEARELKDGDDPAEVYAENRRVR